MKRCKGILEEHTGAFSGFRGIAKLSMISYLALDGSPERRMQKALLVYEAMKEHFFSSQYLSVASMMISGKTFDDGSICSGSMGKKLDGILCGKLGKLGTDFRMLSCETWSWI